MIFQELYRTFVLSIHFFVYFKKMSNLPLTTQNVYGKIELIIEISVLESDSFSKKP